MFFVWAITQLLLALILSALGTHLFAASLTTATQQHYYDLACYWMAFGSLLLLWAANADALLARLRLRPLLLLFGAGNLLFCAAVLISALQGYSLPFPFAPIGGIMMMASCAAMLLQYFRHR